MATLTQATVEKLPVVKFLHEKLSTPLLQDLIHHFQKPIPSTHGLHGCLHEEKRLGFARQMASHVFCCFVKIGGANIRATRASIDRTLMAEKEEGRGIWTGIPLDIDAGVRADSFPSWVLACDRAEFLMDTLEFLWPWISTENALAIQDFRTKKLVSISTCAEDQLLWQWYCEQFVDGLEFMLENYSQVSEEDVLNVNEVFEIGQKMLSKR
jgi:hypothetical protein